MKNIKMFSFRYILFIFMATKRILMHIIGGGCMNKRRYINISCVFGGRCLHDENKTIEQQSTVCTRSLCQSI